MEAKKSEPTMDNLPDSGIDWAEISEFIEDMLKADNKCTKGWKIIKDSCMTQNLQENSVIVLNTLYDDLYEFFFEQKEDRFEVWRRMENYIRAKYSGLSEKALSRIIATYHIDDR